MSKLKLSPTQQRILEAASKEPLEDILFFMQDLKSPAIAEQVLHSMLKKGLITANEEAQSYFISEEGLKAVNSEVNQIPTPSAESDEIKPPSKKELVIDLLKMEEGATVEQIMEATGWQRHSVYGYMSGTLKKSKGLSITSTKEPGGKRIYKIL